VQVSAPLLAGAVLGVTPAGGGAADIFFFGDFFGDFSPSGLVWRLVVFCQKQKPEGNSRCISHAWVCRDGGERLVECKTQWICVQNKEIGAHRS